MPTVRVTIFQKDGTTEVIQAAWVGACKGQIQVYGEGARLLRVLRRNDYRTVVINKELLDLAVGPVPQDGDTGA